MPRFSNSSLNKLDTCHTDLQKLFKAVIKNYDCTILEGERTTATQQEYFRQGKSTLDGINQKSKHQSSPSLAVDCAPYPIDWNDKERFYHFVGYVKGVADQLGIKIRCGADWNGDNNFKDQSFHDLPHYELVE